MFFPVILHLFQVSEISYQEVSEEEQPQGLVAGGG